MKKDHEVDIDYLNLRFHKDYFDEEPSTDEKLSYSNLLNKWYKLATLEYIKKAKELKINLSKDPSNFKDPNDYIKQITKLRKLTFKVYCITESGMVKTKVRMSLNTLLLTF
ncbi:hypothetical protein ACTFIY_006411 [Dictyostelium cf. discoideum]